MDSLAAAEGHSGAEYSFIATRTAHKPSIVSHMFGCVLQGFRLNVSPTNCS